MLVAPLAVEVRSASSPSGEDHPRPNPGCPFSRSQTPRLAHVSVISAPNCGAGGSLNKPSRLISRATIAPLGGENDARPAVPDLRH